MNPKHIGSNAKDMINGWCKKDPNMRKDINKAIHLRSAKMDFNYKFSTKISKQLIEDYSITKLFNKLKAFGKDLAGVKLDLQYTKESIMKYTKRCSRIKKAIRERKQVIFTTYDEHKGFVKVEPLGAYRCPLCKSNPSCTSCPIDIVMDSGGCVQTPYRLIDKDEPNLPILLKQMEAEVFFLIQVYKALKKLRSKLYYESLKA